MAPYGVCWDGVNNESNWMTHSGDIYKGYLEGGPGVTKIFDSLDPNDDWQYLAKGQVNGVESFIMFNDTEDRVYIRNATSGAEWGSWTYPNLNPEYIRGLDIEESNDEILIYNQGWAQIERFSLTGTHLDDMLLPYPTIQAGKGMVLNPTTGNMIMNSANDSGFYTITFTNGTEYSSHETFNYSNGGAGGTIFTDATVNPNGNTIHLSARDPVSGHVQEEVIYKLASTPSPIPTPTIDPTAPTPTPTSQQPSGIGIFRPDSGLWAIQGVTRSYFGGSNDTPIYKDFNGDGRKDIGIFRPSSGLWAIKGITRAYFGGSSDEPVPSDYNGDNTTDVGIFRPDSGLWAIRGVTRAYFGGSSDNPQPGEYAGDGTAAIGIFRPASGLWAIWGVTRSYFGGATDEPVPGDYDGDSTEDIGIFRETTGLWAIKAVTRCYFGGVGDIPVR